MTSHGLREIFPGDDVVHWKIEKNGWLLGYSWEITRDGSWVGTAKDHCFTLRGARREVMRELEKYKNKPKSNIADSGYIILEK